MLNPNIVMRPICIGSHQVEEVESFKLLGVIISEDLKWKKHVEYIIAKASKRLYALRLLKRANVPSQHILKVYISNVRSVLEYAAPVWQDISQQLSDALESIQKRALKIILPGSTYSQVLSQMDIPTLKSRRDLLCQKLIAEMRNNPNHPISFLLPKPSIRPINYNLRSTGHFKETIDTKRTKRTSNFITFRYFN